MFKLLVKFGLVWVKPCHNVQAPICRPMSLANLQSANCACHRSIIHHHVNARDWARVSSDCYSLPTGRIRYPFIQLVVDYCVVAIFCKVHWTTVQEGIRAHSVINVIILMCE